MTTRAALRTVIVDDEPLAVERLAILCHEVPAVDVVAQTTDPVEALTLMTRLSPDLVLLDIAMPEIDGLDVARAAGRLARPPSIVFCTAYEHFAVEAFAVAAVDYLLKPVAPDRLAQAVDRIRRAGAGVSAKTAPRDDWVRQFWVPHRQRLIRIEAGSIDRIEADRDYMRLHVGVHSYLLRETIAHLAERLDPAMFVRIHRSHIVRRDFIAAVGHDGSGGWSAELNDGTDIRIGRQHLAEVRRMIAADAALA